MRGNEIINQDNPPTNLLSPDPSLLTSSLPDIRGVIETSFVDWPGRLCSVLFLGGCNFRCPFCHNHPLVLNPETFDTIPFSDIQKKLASFKKWLGGVCVSGGEPTLSSGLPLLLSLLKEDGWAVKLDTNGTQPHVLAKLIANKLVDMISMDVKAPLAQEKYSRCAGTKVELSKIKASINLLQQSGIEHEFRMTVLPIFHSEEDIVEWTAMLKPLSKLKLQNFNPKTTLDQELAKEKPFPPEIFTQFQSLVAS